MKINNRETINQVDQKVLLMGWVHVVRKMGKIVFVDLRDRSGLVQVVLVPSELDERSAEIIKDIKPEYVLAIEGRVQTRGAKQINQDL
ncbi:MAG TPA: aspartate--tRNA ligase, partial [Candidatus Komeilibacteria bacterium]|nr:aspartate--tRNA ligase [Candidatus Komeilibacteria bacterium]